MIPGFSGPYMLPRKAQLMNTCRSLTGERGCGAAGLGTKLQGSTVRGYWVVFPTGRKTA